MNNDDPVAVPDYLCRFGERLLTVRHDMATAYLLVVRRVIDMKQNELSWLVATALGWTDIGKVRWWTDPYFTSYIEESNAGTSPDGTEGCEVPRYAEDANACMQALDGTGAHWEVRRLGAQHAYSCAIRRLPLVDSPGDIEIVGDTPCEAMCKALLEWLLKGKSE